MDVVALLCSIYVCIWMLLLCCVVSMYVYDALVTLYGVTIP
jgi:hypothetical protein